MSTIVFCIIIAVLLLAVEYFVVSSHYRSQQQHFSAELEAERKAHQADLQRIEDIRQQAEKGMADAKKVHEEALANERLSSDKRVEELKKSHEEHLRREQVERAKEIASLEKNLHDEAEKAQKQCADYEQRLRQQKEEGEKALHELKMAHEKALAKAREDAEQRIVEEKSNSDKRVEELKKSNEAQLEHERELRNKEQSAHEQHLRDVQASAKEQREKELGDLKKVYDNNLAMFKDSVKADTEQLLKQRSEELQKTNVKQMDDIFKPLRENITRMEESMKQNREAQVSDTSQLKTVMEAMISRTTEIGKQADELSSALRNQNKTMGNWGELILTQLLESQGLREGVHFDAQKAMRDESGELQLDEESQKRLIPDVILHLTDSREVIIDAKVSLKAFTDYQNATTDEERELFAQEHLRSMKNHVKELSGKDYSRYIPKSHFSSDFVIMFVPNEGAIQLMMATEPQYWDEAFNKYRVFIVGGQTLVAALHIIELTWRQELQERNTQSIIEEAQKLLDRIVDFMDRYRKVGECLGKAQTAYAEAEAKALNGTQSVFNTAQRLTNLGVKGKKALPKPKNETQTTMNQQLINTTL